MIWFPPTADCTPPDSPIPLKPGGRGAWQAVYILWRRRERDILSAWGTAALIAVVLAVVWRQMGFNVLVMPLVYVIVIALCNSRAVMGEVRMEPWRNVILVLGLPLYIFAAVTLVTLFDRPNVWVELAIYVGLGILWAFPLKAVFKGGIEIYLLPC